MIEIDLYRLKDEFEAATGCTLSFNQLRKLSHLGKGDFDRIKKAGKCSEDTATRLTATIATIICDKQIAVTQKQNIDRKGRAVYFADPDSEILYFDFDDTKIDYFKAFPYLVKLERHTRLRTA